MTQFNSILHKYLLQILAFILFLFNSNFVQGACPNSTVTGTVTIQDGETCTGPDQISITGTLTIYGTLNMPANSEIIVENGGELIIKDGGTINFNDGGTLTVKNNGKLTNETEGTINMGNGSSGSVIENSGSVVNDGLIEQNDPGGEVNNTGAGDWTGKGAVNNDGNSMTNGTGNLPTQLGRNEPLPVTLNNFSAITQKGKVVLNWSTVSEINFSHFIVQRSTDGKNYENVGKVEGVGNSTSIRHYDFTDTNPKNGMNFYRLKAVDIDDTFEYHKVIGVHVEVPGAIRIMPNPVNGSHFQLRSKIPDATMTIVDKNGRQIESFNIQEGRNQINPRQQLHTGLYIVLVKQNNQVVNSSKLIVK